MYLSSKISLHNAQLRGVQISSRLNAATNHLSILELPERHHYHPMRVAVSLLLVRPSEYLGCAVGGTSRIYGGCE